MSHKYISGNEEVYVLTEGDFMWPTQGENCPEEVMLEIEVISTWEEDKEDRTIVDLDNASHGTESGECSDYGSGRFPFTSHCHHSC